MLDLTALCPEHAQGALALQAWHTAWHTGWDGGVFVDLFGWCTWDAFYQDVSPEKVREGMESFRRGGVEPKLVILDDGWQEVRDLGERRGKRLCGFGANEKFPGGLRD